MPLQSKRAKNHTEAGDLNSLGKEGRIDEKKIIPKKKEGLESKKELRQTRGG